MGERFLALLDILDRMARAFDATGARTPEGQGLYQAYFTGDNALFSDSSDKEKRRFGEALTFPHPGAPGSSLSCPWHGKVRHMTLRLHFSWPVEAANPSTSCTPVRSSRSGDAMPANAKEPEVAHEIDDIIVGLDRRPPAPETARPGRGRVAVERIGGRSVVCRAWATSPLRLLTPRNHGHAAWVYTSSHGGGLVDGDDVAVEASVGPGAAAFLSTQSATKVYRSPRGTRTALDADVGEGGLLVAAPDAVVCFAGSRYRQTQRIALSPGGRLVLVDRARRAGAIGRAVALRRVRQPHRGLSRGRLVVHDATALRASDGRPRGPSAATTCWRWRW